MNCKVKLKVARYIEVTVKVRNAASDAEILMAARDKAVNIGDFYAIDEIPLKPLDILDFDYIEKDVK